MVYVERSVIYLFLYRFDKVYVSRNILHKNIYIDRVIDDLDKLNQTLTKVMMN
jgi:hypothetical protein